MDTFKKLVEKGKKQRLAEVYAMYSKGVKFEKNREYKREEVDWKQPISVHCEIEDNQKKKAMSEEEGFKRKTLELYDIDTKCRIEAKDDTDQIRSKMVEHIKVVLVSEGVH